MSKTAENKNQEWWEKRIANNIWKEYNNLEYRNRELLSIFQTASKNIRDELYELAEKYSKDGVLSRTDMYRQKHLQELEQKYHEIIEELGNKTEQMATGNMQEAFKNVNQLTGEAMNTEEFAIPNKKVMNAVLKEPWQGSDFSSRLWGSKDTVGQMQKLERALDAVLTYGLQTGQSVTQMAVNLNNVMGKGFNESLRLVRTESMHYMNQAALMRYKDSDIDKVQIIAALDERTCSECEKYHEKIYPIDKCPVLPFHPNCRCTVIPYIDEEQIDENFNKSALVKEVKNSKIELTRKISNSRSGFKFISDKMFDDLTVRAKKNGATILRGTNEVEEHLENLGAAASNIGDTLLFRKDVCISEVLEETYHYEQNLKKLNDDKDVALRSILNEIDAKQYLLDNADKYKIPRNEIKLTKKQLESYQKALEEYKKKGV